jgi:hypothetical protein
MIFVLLSLLAIVSLAVGTMAIYGALIERFPIRWLYVHYFVRKPIVWSVLLGSASWVAWLTWRVDAFPCWSLGPLLLMVLAVVLTYRMHQETAFPAIDFPPVAQDPLTLPLPDDAEVAVIEVDGVTRAYALDHLIHHHIINDHFGERIVAVTYCAMCRTIIPFDVTELGPLFVASFKNANMVVGDRRTRTFFQQATFDSIMGLLHPSSLTMVPFQTLTWAEVKRLDPLPLVANVTERDLREFQLPIPGIWRKIVASEATPGLSVSNRDRSLPSRTRVIGIMEPGARSRVYLKAEIEQRNVVEVEDDITLVATDGVVNGFESELGGSALGLQLTDDARLTDREGTTTWDLRGRRLDGDRTGDLVPVAISDEYWFSWKRFHPDSELVRL